MSDDADRADVSIEIQLAAARMRRKPFLLPIGRCYNCDEPIGQGLFCDVECRDDYEKRTR